MARLSTALLLSSAGAAIALVGALQGCGGSALSSSLAGDDGADAAGGSTNDSTRGGEGGTGVDGSIDTGDASSDGGKVLHVPAVHRATTAVCSHDRAPGNPDTNIMSPQCSADSDCTGGADGRCLTTTHGARNNYCSYDSCFSDTDCSGKQVCTCRAAGSNDANYCAPGNCKVDADCGVGGYCSPSADPSATNDGTTGWWCHTAADECSDDTDCTTTKGSGPPKCVYDPTLTHWTCSAKGFFPP